NQQTQQNTQRTMWRWREEAIGVVMVGFLALVLATLVPSLLPGTQLVHLQQGRLHAGVGFVLCALVFFLLRAPRRGALSSVFACLLLSSIGWFVWQSSADHAPQRTSEFTLISFNMLGSNARGQEIATYLTNEAPDVVFALEALALRDDLDAMAAVFPHRAGCWPGPRCDMALFSKHPFGEVEIVPFDPINGRLVRAQVMLPEGQITLVAAHLTKPYWGVWHEVQMDQLVDLLQSIDGPVVLAGDFNSQAFVATFREHVMDGAQMQLASGMVPTWPALPSLPLSMAGFAIDHVLVRGAITPVSVGVIEDPLGSNHRGLIARFDLDGS
ncbi:MAG: endonuclease/exonuclease/phosphatase family protein, partial [Devosiaceae bacterium]